MEPGMGEGSGCWAVGECDGTDGYGDECSWTGVDRRGVINAYHPREMRVVGALDVCWKGGRIGLASVRHSVLVEPSFGL